MLTTMTKLVKRLNPLSRYERCWCLTLYRVGRYKAELCYAPADYEPREHVHKNSDGEFWVLYGKNRYIYRKVLYDGPGVSGPIWAEEGYNIDSRSYWKLLSVRARTPHAFLKGDSPMIWICFEKWKPGTKVTSVAEDLVLT